MGLAFINVFVQFIRQKRLLYLKLVKSRAFSLVGCYVVLKGLPMFPLFH